MPVSDWETDKSSARVARNTVWELEHVRDQYSYGNSHSDLYRYLSRWMPVDQYLNIGYTTPGLKRGGLNDILYLIDILGLKRPGQVHLHADSQLRLVDLVAEKLIELHKGSPYSDDTLLLDIGSGRGGPAARAFQKYGLNVWGIDITPFNVERASQNARKLGIHQDIGFSVGDALALPTSDASFTIGWSIESPAHFSDKAGFVREMGRVIKTGGVVAVADLLVNEQSATASEETRRIYEQFLETWDVPYLETFDGYKEAFWDAGFELCESSIITRNNLGIFHRYGELFLWLSQIRPLYNLYKSYFRMKTGADLDNVYRHIFISCQALRARMIDYGLFWAVRR